MISADKISKTIGLYIEKELNFDKSKTDIIVYGLFAAIQMILSLMFTILFGIITDTLVESLIITFAIVLLRKYTGGVHLSTPNKCLIMGLLVTVIPAIIIKQNYMSINHISLNVITMGVLIIALINIIKYAPVDHGNKRIKKQEKRIRLKKSSLIILTMFSFCILIAMYVYNSFGNEHIKLYILCIIYGILWQVFTLTKVAAKIISF